ncbi:MAG: phosphoribosyl-AMP cyclohydrolase [Rhizobiales bacterium]|nr:phosphoribosyl-AMP cyclohydrolase [Hyphomicrobiales bacterium]MBG18555.1 phosphoribosyl-AMP cyclohydrolase [Hyphomicrobiales bacterium]|tara:strand:- start:131 stop:577 length:447 start_codon:yes stop_codon:yes gene_type:complete
MALDFSHPLPDKARQEEGDVLAPRFNADGLITAVTVDAGDGTVLMLAHMNAEALDLSIQTGVAHYFSRSRNALWKKGETSGNLQEIEEILVDCDQDAVVLRVRVKGHDASCHTGRRSCFYRAVRSDGDTVKLVKKDQKIFEPDEVYAR